MLAIAGLVETVAVRAELDRSSWMSSRYLLADNDQHSEAGFSDLDDYIYNLINLQYHQQAAKID